jgi:diguanylate cyclase (GGDEF)-like protein
MARNYIDSSSSVSDDELLHIGNTNRVSGVGVQAGPAVSREENDELINSITKQNEQNAAKAEEERRVREQQSRLSQEEVIRQRQADINARRAAREEQMRRQIAEQEALEEEQRRLAEENSPWNRAKSFFARKPSPEPEPVQETVQEPVKAEGPKAAEVPVPEEPEIQVPETPIQQEQQTKMPDAGTAREQEPVLPGDMEAPWTEEPGPDGVPWTEEEAPWTEEPEVPDSAWEEPPEEEASPEPEEPEPEPEPASVTEKAQEPLPETPQASTEDMFREEEERVNPISSLLSRFTAREKAKGEQKEERKASGKKPKKASVQKRPAQPAKKKPQENAQPDWKALACRDALTGLLNNNAFQDDIKNLTEDLSVLLFDINGLGIINDINGYEAGTAVIAGLGKIIEGNSRGRIYRTDGGTFALLDHYQTKEHMLSAAEKIQSAAAGLSQTSMPVSISFGSAFQETGRELAELSADAGKSLSSAKEAYRKEHAKRQERSYDDGLTSQQRSLKQLISSEHIPITGTAFDRIRDSVEQNADSILTLFMTSPDFNTLFIFFDVDEFLDLMAQVGMDIDFSYIYAVHPGGALYYGPDEYYSDVTDLFQSMASDVRSADSARNPADIIARIPGINIFQHIFFQ